MARLLLPLVLRAALDDVAEHRRLCSALLSMRDLDIYTEEAAWRRRLALDAAASEVLARWRRGELGAENAAAELRAVL